MRRMVGFLLGLAVLGAPLTAAAQGGGGTKDTTTYDFQGDDVTGNLVKPDESNIQGEQHGKTSSLIDIRSDFVPEMLKTVEDL